MRKADHRNQPRQRGCRATALLLATLLAVPAFGGQKPEKAMLWETFVRQKPGTPAVLVLHDGQRLQGRLVAAELGAVEVLDLTGLGLSTGEQKRLVKDVLRARQVSAQQAQAPAAPVSGSAALVRRVTRDEVVAVHVLRDGWTAGRVLKTGLIAVGLYYLMAVLVWAAAGAPPSLT